MSRQRVTASPDLAASSGRYPLEAWIIRLPLVDQGRTIEDVEKSVEAFADTIQDQYDARDRERPDVSGRVCHATAPGTRFSPPDPPLTDGIGKNSFRWTMGLKKAVI